MQTYLDTSIMKRAQEKGLFRYMLHNLTDWTVRPTRRVDDRPYGWWAGTILSIEPLTHALRDLRELYGTLPIYFMSPTGTVLNQEILENLTEVNLASWWCILICGHYEGIDARIFELFPITQLSLWEYVLSSGELASLVLIDGIVRLIPWVIHDASHKEDSYSLAFDRKKEYPQFSRPEIFEWLKVPEVLISWDHKKIEKWKKEHLS
jgi:tRNA (guanine37-N1)-methyltransferase